MNLKFFPESLLTVLKRNIPENVKRYAEQSVWLESHIRSAELPELTESSIEIDGIPVLLEDAKPVSDVDAATRMYDSFRCLKPVQASDERLWAYLCHCEPFYGYVRARWLKEGSEPKEQAVLRRFFFENSGVGGITRNALARLWWYGYLTHEDGAPDPYVYTKMLLRYQDTPVGLFERNLGKNPSIVKQVSKYISENATGWKDRSHTIQKLIRNLNSAGGAVVLDALSDSGLYALCGYCAE